MKFAMERYINFSLGPNYTIPDAHLDQQLQAIEINLLCMHKIHFIILYKVSFNTFS